MFKAQKSTVDKKLSKTFGQISHTKAISYASPILLTHREQYFLGGILGKTEKCCYNPGCSGTVLGPPTVIYL